MPVPAHDAHSPSRQQCATNVPCTHHKAVLVHAINHTHANTILVLFQRTDGVGFEACGLREGVLGRLASVTCALGPTAETSGESSELCTVSRGKLRCCSESARVCVCVCVCMRGYVCVCTCVYVCATDRPRYRSVTHSECQIVGSTWLSTRQSTQRKSNTV